MHFRFKPLFLTLLIVAAFNLVGFSFSDNEKGEGDISKEESETVKNKSLIYETRLAKINKSTPIELDYNEVVGRYIDLYINRKRDLSSKILGRSELYYPIFEEALDKYDLPLELKHLAVVESALNPVARSKSGAVGLWQFLYNSGKMFDLRIDSYVDERRDPYKSTEVACKYLEYLYRTFNDWQLALAAYNGGPGTVKNAIERSGGKTNFWEIREFLPTETQGYVPAFIAVNYMMNYSKQHDIVCQKALFSYSDVDTVVVTQSVSFIQISKVTGVSLETIKQLNPSYKKNYIPVVEKPENLILPNKYITIFVKNESKIYAYNQVRVNYNTALINAGSTKGKVKLVHTVQKGEYFHKIAIKYGCTADNIKAWNGLTSNFIFSNQNLDIWIDKQNAHRFGFGALDLTAVGNTDEILIPGRVIIINNSTN
jgi:membrane-bound lytic murein transglycosylase D